MLAACSLDIAGQQRSTDLSVVTSRLLPLSNCHRAYCLAAAGAIPCFCCCILNSEILIRWLIGSHNFSGVFLNPAVDNAQHFTWLLVLCTTLILRAGLGRRRARVQIAAATLSGNSLRQTVHTHCASVHQAAKLVAAFLRVARVTAGLA